VILVGRLTVLAEENDALIRIGDEFLDDVLRERFRSTATSASDAMIELEQVRITVEVLDESPAVEPPPTTNTIQE